MQIGDLVCLKANPDAMGIIMSFREYVYKQGMPEQEVWPMAMVHWNNSNYLSTFEVSKLEVIG